MWEPNVTNCLIFLTSLYNKGLSYSAINTCRSTLSSMLGEINGVAIGQHKLVVNFMKGVSRLRPAAPRYSITWNPDAVLIYMRTLETNSCSLKELSLKLVGLLALATGQRVQTIVSIQISNILWGNPIQIILPNMLKTTSVSKSNPILVLPYFHELELCPATILVKYVERTKNLK